MIPVIIFSDRAREHQKAICLQLDTEILSKPVYCANWDSVIQKMCSYFDD